MAIRRIIIEEININIKTLLRIREYAYTYIISVEKDIEEERRRENEEYFRQKAEQRGEIIDQYPLRPRGILPGDTDLQKLFKHRAKVKVPEDTAYKKFMEHFEALGENETKIFIQIYTKLKNIGSEYDILLDIYKEEDSNIKSEASQSIINDIVEINKFFHNLKNIYKKFFNEEEFNEEMLEHEIGFLLRD